MDSGCIYIYPPAVSVSLFYQFQFKMLLALKSLNCLRCALSSGFADAIEMSVLIIMYWGHHAYLTSGEGVRKVLLIPGKILSRRPMLCDARPLLCYCLYIHDKTWFQSEQVVYESWHCVITQHIVSVEMSTQFWKDDSLYGFMLSSPECS